MFKMTKQPKEIETRAIDFAKLLVGGEVIASAVVSAINLNTSANAPEILEGTHSIVGTKVYQTIKAGMSGTKYKVTFLVTTDFPHKYEEDLEVKVKEQ